VEVAAGLPSVTVPALADGLPAFALFVAAGLAASNGEARRLIRGGGARLDDAVITDEGQTIQSVGVVKLSAGKKQHVMVSAG
jgi:tyrosyl-tRNA synthetase